MNRDYPALPVNTPEQDAQFLSLYVQRDRSIDWEVTLSPLTQDRTEAQNSLMWHWNGEVAKQANLSPEWVHGDSKMNILLPLMKSWGGKHLERAEHINEILDCLTSYKLKVSVSYDKIRTKKKYLGVRKMAEYLTDYSRFYSDHGIILTNSADYDLAMGVVV